MALTEKQKVEQLRALREFTFGGKGTVEDQMTWTRDAAKGIDLSPRAKLEGKVDTKSRLKHNLQRIAEEKAKAKTKTLTPVDRTGDIKIIDTKTKDRYIRDQTPSRTEGPKGKASEGRTTEEWAALGEMGRAKQAYEAAGGTWSPDFRRQLTGLITAGTVPSPTKQEISIRRQEQITSRKLRADKGWYDVSGSYRGKTAEEWYRAGRPGLAREALLGKGGNYLYGDKELERFRAQRSEWDNPVDVNEVIDTSSLQSFNLEGIQPLTFAELTDDMLLSNRLAQILDKNNPLFRAASTRVYQIMQGRGIANSSIAEQAVMAAILNVAIPIATHEVNESIKLMYHNNELSMRQIEAQNKFIYDTMLKKLDGAIDFNLKKMVQSSQNWQTWIAYTTQMMSQAGVSAEAIDQWRSLVGNIPR